MTRPTGGGRPHPPAIRQHNPTGNDLSHALSDKLRREISKIARDTLDAADEHGWEHVFGAVETKQAAIPRMQVLRSAAAVAPIATRPWSCEE